MTRKRLPIIVSIALIGVLISGISFAGQSSQTDIPVDPDVLEYQQQLSIDALAQAHSQFQKVIDNLTALEANLNPLEKEQLEKAIILITAKKDKLKNIDVYFIKGGATADFDSLESYYTAQGIVLEDLVGRASNTAGQQRSGGTIIGAIGLIPTLFLSESSRDELTTLIEDDKLRAVGGGNNSSRISISTIVVQPNTADPSSPTFEVKTVVVIATDAEDKI